MMVFVEITISGGNPEYTVILDGQQETTQNSGVFVFENLEQEHMRCRFQMLMDA